MKLLDFVFGSKCADCTVRIKGAKLPLAENKWLCQPCKNERDRKRKIGEKEARQEAERKRREEEQQAHYFWAGEHVIPILADDRRSGEVNRLLGKGMIEVDWYAGDKKGVVVENQTKLRLDPASSENLNPYRQGDLVLCHGIEYRITGVWDAHTVGARKTTDDERSSTRYELRVSELSPSGSTDDHLKLRATRVERAPVFAKPMAACPQCHGVHLEWPLEELKSIFNQKHQPIAIICQHCERMTPLADWFSHNKIS